MKETVNILRARTGADYIDAHRLFRAYQQDLGLDLEFQDFSRELASLPGEYGPPHGTLLLAETASRRIGCVALRRLEAKICEMKRLYVLPGYHGRGIGRRLVEAIIGGGRSLGYSRMRLDTIAAMEAAISLYRSIGFQPIAPYRSNPLESPAFYELML
jgi:putative acetyltransferase